MWLITAIAAYILCAIGYAYLRSGDLSPWRLAWIMPLIFAGSICFAVTYRIGPKFLTIWFVSTGIGVFVGLSGSRALREKCGMAEILGIALVISGAMLLMWRRQV